MWVGIVTIFPDLVRAAMQEGVVGRAVKRGDIALELFNPRDYTEDKFRNVDDRPYGGGPGMVMLAQPLADCVAAARKASGDSSMPCILMSPQGSTFDHKKALSLSNLDSLLLIAGRYEGIDERFIDRYVDEELSIGDYVLSGGELPALVVLDAIGRLVSGTLSNPESATSESYSNGLLDFPQYTRPRCFEGSEVPEVLIGGDHAAVDRWRRSESIRRTWERRPDLLLNHQWSKEDRELASSMHADTKQSDNKSD